MHSSAFQTAVLLGQLLDLDKYRGVSSRSKEGSDIIVIIIIIIIIINVTAIPKGAPSPDW